MINSKVKSLLLVAGLSFLHVVGYADNQKEKMSHFAQIAYDNLDSDPKVVAEYSNKLILLAEQQNDSVFLSYGLKLQGTIQDNLLNYSAALHSFLRSSQLNDKDVGVLRLIGDTHRKAGNFKEALYYYEAVANRLKGEQMSLWAGQQGLLYLDKGDYMKAEKFFAKELEYAQSIEDSLRHAVDMAHYYNVRNELVSAEKYLDKATEMIQPFIQKGEQLYLQACFFSTLGQYHLAKQQIAPAKMNFEKALKIAQEQKLGVVKKDAYEGLLDVAFEQQDRVAYEKYSKLKEAFLKERNRELNKYYEILIESKQKMLAIERDKAQKAKDKVMVASIYWIAGVVFLLLVVAGMVYMLRNYKKQLEYRMQELQLKDNKIDDLQERLLSKVTMEKD